MKILKLTAENFKKLSAVEITPDGNVVVISGKNAAGKSSVLDAIEATLRGGRCLPKQPIKAGEIRGKTETLLGEITPEYKVTRKFFGTSSTLKVESIGENTIAEVRSPQAFLDGVVGSISFDPLAFLNKTPSEQRDSLLIFLNLNLDEFTEKIANIKAQRSEVKKEKERKLHEAESITTTPNLPPQEVSSESLLAELSIITIHNEKCQEIAAENRVGRVRLQSTEVDIATAEKSIRDWQARLVTLQTMKADVEKTIRPEVPTQDSAEVEAKLKSLSATNEAIRLNAQKKQAMTAMERCVEGYSKLGDDIKVVENQKAKKLAETVMPVEGLAILPDGLTYDRIPLEQVNKAKRLEICIAISMAMNPKLKVLRIDGNVLDTKSLLALGKIIDDQGYQVWIEKVSDDNTIGFYIEDGHLAGDGLGTLRDEAEKWETPTGEKNEKETN